jgi:hypothetical protein
VVLIVPDAGELILLSKMISRLSNNDADFELRLFANTDEPDSATTASDLTEATFSGYVAKTLNRSNFLAPTTLGNGEAQIVYDTEQVWTVGATGQQVYGYYVLERSTGNLLWLERIGATTLNTADQLKITPTLILRSRKES